MPQVLDRGERIELLVDKTDHLQDDSFAFKRQVTCPDHHGGMRASNAGQSPELTAHMLTPTFWDSRQGR